MPLETFHLYALSAMMQTLGALWGIVFVVYVFVNEYYSRQGGWQGRARFALDLSRQDNPEARERLTEARKAVGRYQRVFRWTLWTGPVVLASILADAGVILANDPAYIPFAVFLFVASLLYVGVVLLHEVWTSVDGTGKLLSEINQAARK